jgi:hypothetical protein
MKVQSSIDRDIEVVETIITQLKTCLKIYYKAKMFDEFEVTLKDIETCKKELQKLIIAKDMQGETVYDAEKHGRKTFF